MDSPVGILDLDGTLVRSKGDSDLWVVTCEPYGLDPERVRRFVNETAGLPAPQVISHLGFQNEMAREVEARYWQLRGSDCKPIEGAEEMLEELIARGYRLYVSSGAHADLAPKMIAACGWSHLFALVIGSREPGELKGPDHYRIIAADLGVQQNKLHTLVRFSCGDGAYEMQIAYDFEVPLRVGFLHEHGQSNRSQLAVGGANRFISHLSELPELLTAEAQP